MSRSIIVVVVGALFASASAGAVSVQALTSAEWREDLDFVAASVRAHHPNPFHAVEEANFQARCDRLYDSIPDLEDYEIVVALAGLVAMLRDGHTAIRGGFEFLTGQYPLRLLVLEDGIFVRGAPRALRGTIGFRLVRVGQLPADEAYARVASMTAHDNEMTLKNRVPDAMVIPEILHALGITPYRDWARFVLEDPGGRDFVLDLIPVPLEERLDWVDGPGDDPAPLYLRQPEVNYWHQYLEDSEILYVQYNRVQNAPDQSIQEYFEHLSQLVGEVPLRGIVLDLRFNGGGNDYLNAPVVEWVQSSLLAVRGRFYVIIGRGTYSAAVKLVTRLDATTDVIFVGEPTGGSPNHFGDAVQLRLPNSGLTLTVSSLYHRDASGSDKPAIEPDLWAPLSSGDYFSGRDPAFEAILSTQKAGSPTKR